MKDKEAAFRTADPIEPYHAVPPVVTDLLSAESKSGSLQEPLRAARNRFCSDGPGLHCAAAVRATNIHHGRHEGGRGLPFIAARKLQGHPTGACG